MTTVSQEAREARIEHLRAEIRRCDLAIEQGTADNWWHIDRDRFRQELDDLTEPRHRQSAERGEAWRPIETAPKDGTRFWGFWPVDDEVGQQQVTYFDQFTLPLPRFCDLADHIDWTQPTAWQPLPTPPEAV